MPGITTHCVSLQRSSQSAPQGGLREEHSIRGPVYTLMSTQMHTPDEGRKAQSLLIELLLFALIEDYGIKSSVFVLAPPALLIIDLPPASRAGWSASGILGLRCHP